MAFLATRFTPRHRNLGRRRRRVRAEAFAPDLATVPFLADNLEPEPVCVAYWRRIWVAASAAPQQTATCVLRRLNTEICPAKGPVAVGAGALSVVAVRRPRQPRWRWSWCPVPCATYRLPRSFVGRFRRQRPGLLLVPAPADPFAAVARAAPGVAGGSRGTGRRGRVCRAGRQRRTASVASPRVLEGAGRCGLQIGRAHVRTP